MSRNPLIKLDILAIGAHPDDIEVAAGGTLLSHVDRGRKVGLLDLTKGELSTRGNVMLRSREAYEVSRLLGASVREQMDLPDGFFTSDEISLLQVVRVLRKYRPEVIILNAMDDRHPDHRRAALLVEQATFLSNLVKVKTLGDDETLQAPWCVRTTYYCIQDRTCKPDIVVDISAYIERKFEVISAYRSQFFNPDSSDPDTPISGASFFEALRGRNAMWGRQVGVEYGEGFTLVRPLGLKDLFNAF